MANKAKKAESPTVIVEDKIETITEGNVTITQETITTEVITAVKRGRGRPKGSKNKPKVVVPVLVTTAIVKQPTKKAPAPFVPDDDEDDTLDFDDD